jgi:hypothetical protein
MKKPELFALLIITNEYGVLSVRRSGAIETDLPCLSSLEYAEGSCEELALQWLHEVTTHEYLAELWLAGYIEWYQGDELSRMQSAGLVFRLHNPTLELGCGYSKVYRWVKPQSLELNHGVYPQVIELMGSLEPAQPPMRLNVTTAGGVITKFTQRPVISEDLDRFRKMLARKRNDVGLLGRQKAIWEE